VSVFEIESGGEDPVEEEVFGLLGEGKEGANGRKAGPFRSRIS